MLALSLREGVGWLAGVAAAESVAVTVGAPDGGLPPAHAPMISMRIADSPNRPAYRITSPCF